MRRYTRKRCAVSHVLQSSTDSKLSDCLHTQTQTYTHLRWPASDLSTIHLSTGGASFLRIPNISFAGERTKAIQLRSYSWIQPKIIIIQLINMQLVPVIYVIKSTHQTKIYAVHEYEQFSCIVFALPRLNYTKNCRSCDVGHGLGCVCVWIFARFAWHVPRACVCK